MSERDVSNNHPGGKPPSDRFNEFDSENRQSATRWRSCQSQVQIIQSINLKDIFTMTT